MAGYVTVHLPPCASWIRSYIFEIIKSLLNMVALEDFVAWNCQDEFHYPASLSFIILWNGC